jgi:RHS repeat-associated protein
MGSAGQRTIWDAGSLASRAACLPEERATEYPRASYNRARYYDPSTGRFASEDPKEFYGGDADLYRYVWNESTNDRDPSGWWGTGVILSAGAGWGLSPAMAAGSISGQSGVFWGGPAGVNTGNVLSYGGFMPDPHSNGILSAVDDNSSCSCSASQSKASNPSKPSNSPKSWGAGAWIGVGVGAFITNANSAADLSGPFDNFEINTPFGTIAVEWGRNSSGRPIVQVSIPRGPSAGAGIARYKTNSCVM